MDNRAVQDFYRNKAMREAVQEYILTVLRKEAIDMVFERQDVFYIADAKDLLDKAFKQMEAEFRPAKTTSTINEAR